MKLKKYYEWDVETWDSESGDILDHDHCKSFSDCLARSGVDQEGLETHIVLILDIYNEVDGFLKHRSWAYLNDDGSLPETFEDGDNKVPKRFYDEVMKAKQ
jgi:hypothetical protein